MKRIACVFLSLVLLLSLSTPLAEAKENSSTSETSESAVAEVMLSAISDGGMHLSDSDYDLIRLFVKQTKPSAVTDRCLYFDLDEELMLVVNRDRSIELHKGPWVIKDLCDAWLTLDNAGLAEPEFPVFGFADSTWIFDSAYNVIRKWTLGKEEELTVPMPLKGDPVAGDIFVSVYKSYTNDSDNCFLYNTQGELVMMDADGNITQIADDYAYFVKRGVARLENSLYYISSNMQLVHVNLLTQEKTLLKTDSSNAKSQATALDFSIVARYYNGKEWKSIPYYINDAGKKADYSVSSVHDWLVGPH